MAFIEVAIKDHKQSKAYQVAIDAELYYDGENPTINRYEKILYDMRGMAHKDMYSANHKIASSFFGFNVDQAISYLLGNGVTFNNDATKKKLGKNFDQMVQQAGEFSQIGGVAFGFWNLDHMDVFSLTEFVPLYDEENGALMAGIRFWQVDADKPLRATLYELDGYTEYIKRKSEDMKIFFGKRTYRQTVKKSEVDGEQILDGDNYPGFPIVPLKNNRKCKSELMGKRNTIDALDLVTSNMVNNVDEGNLIYWVLTNCGGMDDLDDARFVERLKTTHVAHADGDQGAGAEAHTIEVPFTGTIATKEALEQKLYEDFQCFNRNPITAGNQTATAIKASYVPLDLKTDKFESQVTQFINGILEIVGIEDDPSYTRSQIVNKMEEAQTIIIGAPYFDDEYITKKLLTINGDADVYPDMMGRKDAEALDRFNEPPEKDNPPERPVTDDDNT